MGRVCPDALNIGQTALGIKPLGYDPMLRKLSEAHDLAGTACGGVSHIAYGFEPTNDTQVSSAYGSHPCNPLKLRKLTLPR